MDGRTDWHDLHAVFFFSDKSIVIYVGFHTLDKHFRMDLRVQNDWSLKKILQKESYEIWNSLKTGLVIFQYSPEL